MQVWRRVYLLGLSERMVFVGWCEIEFGLICAWRLFYLCPGAIVIDDAYLLRLDHALSDDVIKCVVILHRLHLLRWMVEGSYWADESPLCGQRGQRGHSWLLRDVSLADLRNGSAGLRVQWPLLHQLLDGDLGLGLLARKGTVMVLPRRLLSRAETQRGLWRGGLREAENFLTGGLWRAKHFIRQLIEKVIHEKMSRKVKEKSSSNKERGQDYNRQAKFGN